MAFTTGWEGLFIVGLILIGGIVLLMLFPIIMALLRVIIAIVTIPAKLAFGKKAFNKVVSESKQLYKTKFGKVE